MSSTESEMNALSDGEQESQWLHFLIEELYWKIKLAPTLFSIEKKGLLEKLKNFGSNSKFKHLDIKIKSLCGKFNKKEINVRLITSETMITDSLTKAAPLSSVKKLQDKCLSALSSSNKEGSVFDRWSDGHCPTEARANWSDRFVRPVPAGPVQPVPGTDWTGLSDPPAGALVGQCLSNHRSNTAVRAPLELPCSTG
ncbi:hypothetical protein PCANC_10761 [Puccinia coronata f. sp. avenae]|uniref:Uncharacterized protein n=1 Tax=Puccinia coronata f. sp. avenae TaxID=200324 RepID=A0A2N5VSR7_9BASI|nr:hypothetical protein PCANC_10761 [Puccinia coronata f. sp. avenae]